MEVAAACRLAVAEAVGRRLEVAEVVPGPEAEAADPAAAAAAACRLAVEVDLEAVAAAGHSEELHRHRRAAVEVDPAAAAAAGDRPAELERELVPAQRPLRILGRRRGTACSPASPAVPH